MIDFIQENSLLVLSIIGAIIGFLISFIGLVSKQKPVFILASLAIVGCVVSISYQLYNHEVKQESKRETAAKEQINEAAKRARANIIDEINLTVQKTEITVTNIANKLLNNRVSDVGTELVSIQSSSQVDFKENIAFAKGSPQMWSRYSDWLKSISPNTYSPSLSLRINARHHYNSGLLLAYLLTSPTTADEIYPVVKKSNKWKSFSAEGLYIKNFITNSRHLGHVIIYDESSNTPVAYASAQDFAQELLVYHRLERHTQIDEILNRKDPGTLQNLLKAFPSLKTDIFTTVKPSELVRKMINKQLATALSADGNSTYVVRVEKMIKLAATQ